MAKIGYKIATATTITAVSVGLTANTPRTVLFVTAGASFGLQLKKFRVSYDGITAAAVPVITEICYSTAASNSTAGTGNVAGTILQSYGRVIASGCTGGYACTSEPTVLSPLESFLLTPNGGVIFYDYPLGDEFDTAVSNGFAIRCTSPAGAPTVNVVAEMQFERI